MCPTECRGGLGALPVPLLVPGWALMCRNVSTEICFELLRRGVVGQRGEGRRKAERSSACLSAALPCWCKIKRSRIGWGHPKVGAVCPGRGGGGREHHPVGQHQRSACWWQHVSSDSGSSVLAAGSGALLPSPSRRDPVFNMKAVIVKVLTWNSGWFGGFCFPASLCSVPPHLPR